MTCDLTSGRLLNECQVGRAGIKNLYFTKYNDFAALTGITESGGEITSLGADPITLNRFRMVSGVGNFDQSSVVSKENGTAYISQNITLSLLNIKPEDLANLNALKKGRWTIWTQDYQDKIRLFGRTRGMVATGGSDISGLAAGDRKGYELTLTAYENNYAPFMQDYTTEPFDNYTNVLVSIGGYGPELHTWANAVSDPYGNEANTITGNWVEFGLNGTGANVFQSQGSVVNAGSYAFELNANDTPTVSARVSLDLEAAPFSFVNGERGKISFYARHVGVGGTWGTALGATVNFLTNLIAYLEPSDTTFQAYEIEWVHDADHRYLVLVEASATNDGGIYFDNLSIKKGA